MTEEARKDEVDFLTARTQIEKEIESFIGQSSLELPRFVMEKGETKFSFKPVSIDDRVIFQALSIIKAHIENIRVHTLEAGYVVFQAMGENLYDTKHLAHGIKFKFISIGQESVEVTRKGNFTQDEISACLRIFQIFHPEQRTLNPADLLAKLGVSVYQAAEKAEERKSVAANGAIVVSAAWNKLAGYEKTKGEVIESIILPLRHPEIFSGVTKLTRQTEKSNMPKAVLFEGPPGVGKTTMARIIAQETGIPLVYVPVENILSKYYGESAQNMAAIFDTAAMYDKVILFLDEIDSLAGSREDGLFEATRRILSVLLRKIDGFENRTGVLTLGATNRADDLDHALLSRFDHRIVFPLPGLKERKAIFGNYAKHIKEEELENIAKISEGLSGRTIEDICEAAERRWARMIISGREKMSPPPASLYQDLIVIKGAGAYFFLLKPLDV